MDNILFKVMICDIVKLDWFFYYTIMYMTFKKGIFVPNYAFKTGNACIHNILSEKKVLKIQITFRLIRNMLKIWNLVLFVWTWHSYLKIYASIFL